MLVLKLAPVQPCKMIEAKIVPFFLSVCDETRRVTPLFYLCFALAKATQKYIYIKVKKIWIPCMNYLNFCI